MKKFLIALLICLLQLSFANPHPQEQATSQNERMQYSHSNNVPEIFQEFARAIQDSIAKNDIPGFSIAVVDRNSILWADAFGVLSKQKSDSVTIESVFSLQSISKAVTATAVMFAVQEGLVSLDTPIISYVPDLTVNSRFEEHPERKITLRHLLSHRAGFTHEAPIGNNYQTEFDSFEQHVQSISTTWLKSPVGKIYSYSNLGIDLAGYILQVRSGMPFAEYVKSRLFLPLGMNQSSFDWNVIREQSNRAIGHNNRFSEIPLEYAMIPSGACYTNVVDMAKFMQFHLNRGRIKGKELLAEKYLDEMYRIPVANQKIGYGLGIDVFEKAGEIGYRHGGGGFGFLTSVQWLPHLNIGVVVLTNSANHRSIHSKIAENIIDKLRDAEISSSGENKKSTTPARRSVVKLTDAEYSKYSGNYVIFGGDQTFQVGKKDSLFGAQGSGFFIPFNFFSHDGDFFVAGFGPELDGEYKIVIDSVSQKPLYVLNKIDGVILFFDEKLNSTSGPTKPEWSQYVGKYSRKQYGKVIATHELSMKNGYLYFDAFRLQEYLPGLFYASNGEVVDFRGDVPTYRNIKLFKED
ncbi:beta-lactamase family protein [candidate division KSB1 bacterium]|nr:beta-lactamase family protein [candidate division KSB1 bacterium]